MKRLHIVIFLAFLCLTAVAKGKKQLTILHTNDTHSCVLPMNPNLADTLVAGRGGFLRRITMINQEREIDPELLYIDSGDFSQGSSYYSLFKGEVEIDLMNRMGVTASTIGNHEFDYGLENMASLFKRAKFPIVCSNYGFEGTCLEGIVKPYVIVKRKGVKIGIYALCPKMEGLVSPKNCEGVVYNDPVECSNEMARMLRNDKKCDVVICVSHLGWDEDGDIAMIKASRNIDIVLGGHSHTYFKDMRYVEDLDGRQVPVDQNGKAAIFVGKIIMELEK